MNEIKKRLHISMDPKLFEALKPLGLNLSKETEICLKEKFIDAKSDPFIDATSYCVLCKQKFNPKELYNVKKLPFPGEKLNLCIMFFSCIDCLRNVIKNRIKPEYEDTLVETIRLAYLLEVLQIPEEERRFKGSEEELDKELCQGNIDELIKFNFHIGVYELPTGDNKPLRNRNCTTQETLSFLRDNPLMEWRSDRGFVSFIIPGDSKTHQPT